MVRWVESPRRCPAAPSNAAISRAAEALVTSPMSPERDRELPGSTRGAGANRLTTPRVAPPARPKADRSAAGTSRRPIRRRDHARLRDGGLSLVQTSRFRESIDRIGKEHPALARHFENAIHTGT